MKGKTYGLLRSDEELGFMHASHAYNMSRVSNNMGFLNFNDVVLPEKRNPEDVIFIAYGGSTTFSYNVKQIEAWPYKFQEEMCNAQKNKESCKFTILNGGNVAWSIGHLYKKALIDLPIIKPNYLIIYSGFNEFGNYQGLILKDKIDVNKSIINKEYGLTTKAYNWWWIRRNLLTEKILHYKLLSPLVRATRTIIKKYVYNDNDQSLLYYDEYSLIFDNYIGVLKKFINLAKKHDTQIIFLAQSQGIDTRKTIFFASFSQKAKEKMNELGAIVIDSQEMVDEYSGDKKELFIETGIHYSVKGADLLGKFLLTKLKEKQILITN